MAVYKLQPWPKPGYNARPDKRYVSLTGQAEKAIHEAGHQTYLICGCLATLPDTSLPLSSTQCGEVHPSEPVIDMVGSTGQEQVNDVMAGMLTNLCQKCAQACTSIPVCHFASIMCRLEPYVLKPR